MTTPNARRRRAGSQLTAEAIVDASLRIAARGGDGAFTIRRLGNELGTDPTAIYRHFRDKDELTLTVADRILGEVVDQVPANLTWQDTLRHLARIGVSVVEKYPAVGVAMFSRTLRRPNEFRAVELIVHAIHEAGLSGKEAALYSRIVGDAFNAYAGLRAAVALLDPEVREADDSAWSREYRLADPDSYPNIAQISTNLAGVGESDVLESFVDALIQAIEAAARTQ